jgi:tripartite-type tricarboxylate transporter receptor subunit TctC
MVHVPYRGGGLGGQVQVLFISPVVSVEHIKAGKLRALGGDDGDALGSAARYSDGGRIRAWL